MQAGLLLGTASGHDRSAPALGNAFHLVLLRGKASEALNFNRHGSKRAKPRSDCKGVRQRGVGRDFIQFQVETFSRLECLAGYEIPLRNCNNQLKQSPSYYLASQKPLMYLCRQHGRWAICQKHSLTEHDVLAIKQRYEKERAQQSTRGTSDVWSPEQFLTATRTLLFPQLPVSLHGSKRSKCPKTRVSCAK